MLRYATFNRKLFTTNPRVRTRTIDANQYKRRKFIERRCKHH